MTSGGWASATGTTGFLRRLSAHVAGSSWHLPVLVGAFGALVSGIGQWRPSLWTDEVATITMSTRTLPELFEFVAHRDLVHASYYLVMHGWTEVFGIGQGLLRLPSTLAVGAAAGLMVLLGRRLGGTALGVTAGIVLSVLPRATWAGTEARSFALAMMLATALTVLMTVVLQRRTWPFYLAYGVVAAIGIVCYVFIALVVVAHAVTVAIWYARTRQHRRTALGFVSTVAAVMVATVPFLLSVAAQSRQIHHGAPSLFRTSTQVLIAQNFLGALPARGTGMVRWQLPFNWGIAATLLAVVALALVIVALLPRPSTSAGRDLPSIGQVALPWLALPTVVLVGYSSVRTPLYAPRYLTICVPPTALLIAAGLLALPRRRLQLAVVAVALLLIAPVYLGQRSTRAKQGSDWSLAAGFMGEHARAGDVVVYGGLARKPAQYTRKIAVGYPQDFHGLRDLTLHRSAPPAARLWSTSRPLALALPDLGRPPRVWLISDNANDPISRARHDRALALLAGAGYRSVDHWSWTVTRIDELVR
jgi:mannosyltransferase